MSVRDQVQRHSPDPLGVWRDSEEPEGKRTEDAIVLGGDVTDEAALRERLAQADKLISLGTLVAGVAHEINNPNNYIMVNAPILAEVWRSVAPILDAYERDYGDFSVAGIPFGEIKTEIPGLISGIEDGARRIRRIVQDLKEFAARDDPLRLDRRINVNAALVKAVSLLGHKIKVCTAQFKTQYGKDLPPIRGDLQRIEQVFVNLIQNALESLPDISREVLVETFFDRERDQIVARFRDEGIGIPTDRLPQIMDLFFTTKRASGGTGLGLSVSLDILRQHGGALEVESEEGVGSTFTVRLPAAREPERPKILIVDDDRHTRALLKEILTETGDYSVIEASGGTEACILLGRELPALLILDVMMPEVDGVEVCRIIKREPFLSSVAVIVITGYARSPEVKQIRELGFQEVLAKPFQKTKLLEKVAKVLDASKKSD